MPARSQHVRLPNCTIREILLHGERNPVRRVNRGSASESPSGGMETSYPPPTTTDSSNPLPTLPHCSLGVSLEAERPARLIVHGVQGLLSGNDFHVLVHAHNLGRLPQSALELDRSRCEEIGAILSIVETGGGASRAIDCTSLSF